MYHDISLTISQGHSWAYQIYNTILYPLINYSINFQCHAANFAAFHHLMIICHNIRCSIPMAFFSLGMYLSRYSNSDLF